MVLVRSCERFDWCIALARLARPPESGTALRPCRPAISSMELIVLRWEGDGALEHHGRVANFDARSHPIESKVNTPSCKLTHTRVGHIFVSLCFRRRLRVNARPDPRFKFQGQGHGKSWWSPPTPVGSPPCMNMHRNLQIGND